MCASRLETGALRLQAPAKLNLFLAVTGRRPDGYHDIASVMVAVALYDTLQVVPGGEGIRVVCNTPGVPSDRRNLALRAAEAFCTAAARPAAATIHLHKCIPVGAGLGGGSSDAAAVLRGLNRYWGSPLSARQLHRLAVGIGADVPFFLSARPSLATGIGDRLRPYPGLPPASVLIVYPGVAVSTAAVYERFGRVKMRLTTCQKKSKVSALKARAFDFARDLCNDLEPIAGSLCPVVLEAKTALQEAGANGALMTGSGSAVYGLFDDDRQTARAAAKLASRSEWQTFRTHLLV